MNKLLLRVLPGLLLACAPDYAPDPFDQIRPVQDAGSVTPPTAVPNRDAAEPDDPAVEAALDPPVADAETGAQGACDLSGRWLLTERAVTSAVGARQVIHNWFYLELSQQDSALTVSRSIMCGGTVVGLPPTVITMDDRKAWPAYIAHRSYEGRTGSSQASGSGCQVAFDKVTIVRGASVDTYRELSVPLPKLEQRATASTPGWEDWEGDGKPGVSLRISGSISGTLYLVTRAWNQYSGFVAANASSFTLPLLWNQERSTLGYDGSPLLTTADATRDGDASQHLVEYARLAEAQVPGDEAAICAKVRELAPTLTPNAMK
jgi:hypothetical protein